MYFDSKSLFLFACQSNSPILLILTRLSIDPLKWFPFVRFHEYPVKKSIQLDVHHVYFDQQDQIHQLNRND